MTIEQIKASLKDVHTQLVNARADAVRLASDPNAETDQLRSANENVTKLLARQGALKEALDAEIGQQSANLQEVRDNSDAVRIAADKFRSAGDFFNCIARASDRANPRVDSRLADYLNVRSAASGQNLTTDSEGGYLVPPDYAAELLDVTQTESVLFNDVSTIPVAGNRLVENELDVESMKDSSTTIKGRHGGLIAYWTGEAADIQASKMRFKQKMTELNKLAAVTYATDEMLEDLPALSAFISDSFAKEFAFKRDDAILNGTGTGMPLGVLSASNTALVTIAKETGQAKGTLTLNNILKMWNAMPAKNRANAKWIINQDLEIVLYSLLMNTGSLNSAGESAVEKASATFGMPIYVPAGGLASAPNGLLLGRPIVPVEQAPALGDKGDISLVDLSQYRWIDKSAVDAQTSIHVRFIQDETAFRFTYRAGGRPIWSNAIEAYKGSTQRSPYVALGARA